jgi:hypothetical protein
MKGIHANTLGCGEIKHAMVNNTPKAAVEKERAGLCGHESAVVHAELVGRTLQDNHPLVAVVGDGSPLKGEPCEATEAAIGGVPD